MKETKQAYPRLPHHTKVVGFCVMRKDTYENKLSDTLDSNQFTKSKGTSDAIVLKIERDINKELLAMRKKDEMSENLYTSMRSTGGQPARLYGLAKVHKTGPLLAWNKVLAIFFEKIEGANIETNSLDTREILESTNLEPNENLISLDVKEVVDIALKKLYEQRPQDAALRNATSNRTWIGNVRIHTNTLCRICYSRISQSDLLQRYDEKSNKKS